MYIDYFGALEEHLRPFNFRLHWAKGCITTTGNRLLNFDFRVYLLSCWYEQRGLLLTGKDVRHLYSRWDEFTSKMKEMDPDGKFYNKHLDRWFGDRADTKMKELVTRDMLRFKEKFFPDNRHY